AKEMASHLLELSGRTVLRNIKNYNNGLGHPLTVLKLSGEISYDVAVLEMGMSTPMNEIRRLCSITPPDVAVELNVLPVHLEHLGSIENIAAAKAELVEGMKVGGIAVLNADDPRVLAMEPLANGTAITFGVDTGADVMASEIKYLRFGETRFTLTIKGKSSEVNFPLNGRHNILNALAAAAVGYSFGMGVGDIAAGLSSVESPPQRGEVLHFSAGFTVINDSYNSNPAALLSMTQTLVEGASKTARTIVVAGEMLELGDAAADIHLNIGRRAAEIGVNLLIGVQGLAAQIVEGAESAGIATRFAVDAEEAGAFLVGEVRAGDVILVKGSRGVRTEKVIDALFRNFKLEEKSVATR
ncbi:MAG: Mur ligase family protein, partial [Pyrinomonadaceae bacterium]